MNLNMKITLVTTTIVLLVSIVTIGQQQSVQASDDCEFGSGNCGSGSCYARGVEDGKNNDFGDYFAIDPSGDCDNEEFFPRYYEGFIDGCMDADNSRETCEQFTD